ncbi:MAG: hypothetical protein ACJ8EL_05110 [Rhizomicrobium sp.]|jgi:hypothetical protein
MFERTLGKLMAYMAMAFVLFLLICAGAFFVECASWGQCPTFGKGPANIQLHNLTLKKPGPHP